ncbi:MAG: hypothetical protein BAJATHORv1_10131 [Candidatus Thorarchaeota archaeon]|nr:MAG: hypothetical protein BAJATHORv1_10131 [Candidatus Thorarchaeota archaeon]
MDLPLAHIRGAIVKLVDLAEEAVKVLKEQGEEGIRSDILAEQLDTPKRRVYDVLAVLRALNLVETNRRFNGTTVTWLDPKKDLIERVEYEDIKSQLEEERQSRKDLQVQVAELKEQIRITKSKLRRDTPSVEVSEKTEFNTTQLRIRSLSASGFASVKDSGMEVFIETHEPGMVVDPTVSEKDEHEALLRSLQRM